MATFRNVGGKIQVQVRRKGLFASKTFTSRQEAEQWAWRLEAPFVAPVSARRDGLRTLGDVIEEYARVELPRHRSGPVEAFVLRSLERHWIAGVELAELRSWHIAAYRDDRLREVKANTVQRTINLIRPMLDIARTDWGCPIEGNPAREVTVRAGDDSRQGRLSQEQMQAFLAAIRHRRNPDVVRAVELALETTMRRSELLAMDWRDVDLLQGTVLIPRAKNGRSRTVALTPRALALLEAVPWRHGSVLRCSASAIRCAMARAKKEAGLPDDWCFHKLRHEGISRLWELGLNETEISSMSGHRDWKMLRRYSHVDSVKLASKLQAKASPSQGG
jgi:integrase